MPEQSPQLPDCARCGCNDVELLDTQRAQAMKGGEVLYVRLVMQLKCNFCGAKYRHQETVSNGGNGSKLSRQD